MQKTVIPEVQNDMILSAICEELGVFGAIIILVLFGLLIYRLLFIAQNAPDLYGALIMTGIMSHIAIQVILNVMVVTNMMPNYIAYYQLWWYIHPVPDDRNGNGTWNFQKN